jgi:hypothetical protein
MTKTKYEVHRSGRFIVSYVTTTKNCEEMLQLIRKTHHRDCDDVFVPSGFKIIRVIGNERTIIYTPKNREFWDK